jgi:hypothetical protein
MRGGRRGNVGKARRRLYAGEDRATEKNESVAR